jgi:hypothetical protein
VKAKIIRYIEKMFTASPGRLFWIKMDRIIPNGFVIESSKKFTSLLSTDTIIEPKIRSATSIV